MHYIRLPFLIRIALNEPVKSTPDEVCSIFFFLFFIFSLVSSICLPNLGGHVWWWCQWGGEGGRGGALAHENIDAHDVQRTSYIAHEVRSNGLSFPVEWQQRWLHWREKEVDAGCNNQFPSIRLMIWVRWLVPTIILSVLLPEAARITTTMLGTTTLGWVAASITDRVVLNNKEVCKTK